MTRARRVPRVAPAFDLFDPPAPAPALVIVPEPEPVPEPPAWAIEAARPVKVVTTIVRDFEARIERVALGEHLVIREREDGLRYHRYRAFERATVFFYRETLDELTWGRIDTRRSLRRFDPIVEVGDAVNWEMACNAEARDVIRRLCPEARRHAGESIPESSVYDGPGYILLITDPARRHRLALEAIAAEEMRREIFGRPA